MSEQGKKTDCDNGRQQAARRPFHTSHRAPLYFLALSVVCQFGGVAILSLVQEAILSPVLLLGLHSVVAFLLARVLRLSFPWQIFNLLLAPGVILYSYFNLPAGFAFGALAVTVLLYAPTFWTRVPYYPTTPHLYEVIAEQLPQEGTFRFLDLGCGLGRLLNYLSKVRPHGTFVGVEISPLAYVAARSWMALSGRSHVTIAWKNFWNISLADYDVVYAFLAPGPMPALWQKVKEEMKPGSRFITNTFAVEDYSEQSESGQQNETKAKKKKKGSAKGTSKAEVITVQDGPAHQNTLYVHTL